MLHHCSRLTRTVLLAFAAAALLLGGTPSFGQSPNPSYYVQHYPPQIGIDKSVMSAYAQSYGAGVAQASNARIEGLMDIEDSENLLTPLTLETIRSSVAKAANRVADAEESEEKLSRQFPGEILSLEAGVLGNSDFNTVIAPSVTYSNAIWGTDINYQQHFDADAGEGLSVKYAVGPRYQHYADELVAIRPYLDALKSNAAGIRKITKRITDKSRTRTPRQMERLLSELLKYLLYLNYPKIPYQQATAVLDIDNVICKTDDTVTVTLVDNGTSQKFPAGVPEVFLTGQSGDANQGYSTGQSSTTSQTFLTSQSGDITTNLVKATQVQHTITHGKDQITFTVPQGTEDGPIEMVFDNRHTYYSDEWLLIDHQILQFTPLFPHIGDQVTVTLVDADTGAKQSFPSNKPQVFLTNQSDTEKDTIDADKVEVEENGTIQFEVSPGAGSGPIEMVFDDGKTYHSDEWLLINHQTLKYTPSFPTVGEEVTLTLVDAQGISCSFPLGKPHISLRGKSGGHVSVKGERDDQKKNITFTVPEGAGSGPITVTFNSNPPNNSPHQKLRSAFPLLIDYLTPTFVDYFTTLNTSVFASVQNINHLGMFAEQGIALGQIVPVGTTGFYPSMLVQTIQFYSRDSLYSSQADGQYGFSLTWQNKANGYVPNKTANDDAHQPVIRPWNVKIGGEYYSKTFGKPLASPDQYDIFLRLRHTGIMPVEIKPFIGWAGQGHKKYTGVDVGVTFPLSF